MVKQRCYNCNKKTGLITILCKCNQNFCIKCKNPEQHNCTFNFKEYEKKILEKNMIKVIKKKIQDI